MVGFELPRLLAAIMAQAPHATDVLLAVGRPPQVLADGGLKAVSTPGLELLTPFQTETVVLHLLAMAPASAAARLRDLGAAHFAYSVPGVSRFRVTMLSQRGTFAVTFRIIPEKVPTITELNLPPALVHACAEQRGVVVVSGPAGSGRSTTLAAMIGEMNRSRSCHVVTVEDPIEFLHRHGRSTINQREVGTDTPSLAQGLADALRFGANVVATSELTFREEASMVLEAAESGHLVLTTARGADSASTISRFLSLFPQQEREEVRLRLAGVLRWCFTQRLLCRRGRPLPVVEVWRSIPMTVEHLREGTFDSATLAQVLRDGQASGTVAFDVEVERLVRAGLLDRDEALTDAVRPQELAQRLNERRGEGS